LPLIIAYKEYVLGYKLEGDEYLVFDKKEIDSTKPDSPRL
jgi:non-homologous end joining protein Ku